MSTGRRPYVCDTCGEGFGFKFALSAHIEEVHNPKPPKPTKAAKPRKTTCDECGKTFGFEFALMAHKDEVHKHKGARPKTKRTIKYFCDICGKGYGMSSAMKDHRRLHTGEKPYTCDYCGKTFRASSGLAAHRKHHTGMKGYTCRLCPQKFYASFNLKLHVKNHHPGEKPFSCSYCAETFDNKNVMNEHMKGHDPNIQYVVKMKKPQFTPPKANAATPQQSAQAQSQPQKKRTPARGRIAEHTQTPTAIPAQAQNVMVPQQQNVMHSQPQDVMTAQTSTFAQIDNKYVIPGPNNTFTEEYRIEIPSSHINVTMPAHYFPEQTYYGQSNVQPMTTGTVQQYSIQPQTIAPQAFEETFMAEDNDDGNDDVHDDNEESYVDHEEDVVEEEPVQQESEEVIAAKPDLVDLIKQHKQKYYDDEPPYECLLCGYKFILYTWLVTHLRKAHSNSGPRDEVPMAKKKPFKCHVCKKSYKTYSLRKKHIATFHSKDESVDKCEKCGETFARKVDLNRHVKTNCGQLVTPDGKRPRIHMCTACGKWFKDQYSFKVHQRVHSGEKPYKCTTCGKCFRTSVAARKHVRIHTGQKSCQCFLCGRMFRGPNDVTYHMKKHHPGELPFMCEMCGQKFAKKGYLNDHRKAHISAMQKDLQNSEVQQAMLTHCERIGKSEYKCRYCTEMAYTSQQHFRQHLLNLHPDKCLQTINTTSNLETL